MWQVRFALQASDEPSLVVDADAVWRARGSLPALARQLDSPQETMLAELGKAAGSTRTWTPPLRTARPTALALDTAAAHHSCGRPRRCWRPPGSACSCRAGGPSRRPGSALRITASTPPQPGLVAAGASRLGFDARSPTSATTWPSATSAHAPTS